MPEGPMNETARAPVLASTPSSPPAPRRSRKGLRYALMGAGVAVAVAAGGWGWLNGGRYVSSDNAYVHADMLLVSTDVSGIVQTIPVQEGQQVHQGDVLYRLDPAPFDYAIAGAEARLHQAVLEIEAMRGDLTRIQRDIAAQESVVAQNQATFDRYADLVRSSSVSRADYDQARFRLAQAQHQLESLRQQAVVQLARLGGDPDRPAEQHPEVQQAQAQLDEARRQLERSTVRAPFDGTVTRVETLQPGQYLAAATPGFGLVGSGRAWVEVNPKETDLTYVKPGDAVTFTVDSYPGLSWRGRVASISPATGAQFSVLPAQNTSGNWVKVVQRVPIRVQVEAPPDAPPLRAGMSVVASIDTGHERHLSDLF